MHKKFQFPSHFLFGVSNSATQVEDQLDCPWLKFAKKGHVHAYSQRDFPHEKIRFWSHPEEEIKLASELGVDIFRLSVDWGRVCPQDPSRYGPIQNQSALDHYHEIIKQMKVSGMKVMLTLFHHSLPDWALKENGFASKKVQANFIKFAQKVMSDFAEDVDYWISFNEPSVFSLLTFVAGEWPSYYWSLKEAFYWPGKKGLFLQNMDAMAKIHRDLYQWFKKQNSFASLGIAHNIAHYVPKRFYHWPVVYWCHQFMNLRFIKKTKGYEDFIGLNYYGKEVMKFQTVSMQSGGDYSDSGRLIDAEGLSYFIRKYISKDQKIFITENGIADQGDHLRSYYIALHLKELGKLMQEGYFLQGYIHWTLTDNFEWSDGYGPKFGLCQYMAKEHTRIKRASFYYYQKVINDRCVDAKDEAEFLQDIVRKRSNNILRPMWRSIDGRRALDYPRFVPL